jgi:hypothetical protein
MCFSGSRLDDQQKEKTAGPFGGAPTVRHCTDGGDDVGTISANLLNQHNGMNCDRTAQWTDLSQNGAERIKLLSKVIGAEACMPRSLRGHKSSIPAQVNENG